MRPVIVALTLVALLLLPAVAQEPQKDSAGIYEIGNGVTPPRPTKSVIPRQPELVQKLRISGDVLLSFVVQADGTVRDVKVIGPIGYGLDDVYVKAAMQWRFDPATLNGKPVDVRFPGSMSARAAYGPNLWKAGPILFDLPPESPTPALQTGSMPDNTQSAMETVIFQFSVNREGVVEKILPVQGASSPSIAMLTDSLSKWKFQSLPAAVTGKVMFILGPDQFRYNVTELFRKYNGVPALDAAGAIALPSIPAPSGNVITVEVPFQLQPGELSKLAIRRVKPDYPDQAKRERIQGKVTLTVKIDKQGNVMDITNATGPRQLVPGAIAAVQQWKFQPYMYNGSPRFAVGDIDIDFTIN